MGDLQDGVNAALAAIVVAGGLIVGVDVARAAIGWLRSVIDPYDPNNPYHNGNRGDYGD